MIELVIDFVSVNAYLALHPAKKLADKLGIELKLTPRRTTSELSMVSEPKPNESISERHRRTRAAYTKRDALRYAAVQGLELNIEGRDADSTIALQGLLAANAEGRGYPYAERVFTRYWRGAMALDSIEQVAEELKGIGITAFDANDSRWDLAPIHNDLEEREIVMVPMFCVDGELYMGRQHLPMIEWQLRGYEGPGPL